MTTELSSQEFRDPYDCTPCRIIGSVTFAGSGAYVLYEGRKQLREEHAKYLRELPRLRYSYLLRKGSVGVIGYSLIGLGLYRWIY